MILKSQVSTITTATFIASFIFTCISNKLLLLVRTFVFLSSYFFVPLCSYASTRMMGTATRAESSH